jgi:hypothetical protein
MAGVVSLSNRWKVFLPAAPGGQHHWSLAQWYWLENHARSLRVHQVVGKRGAQWARVHELIWPAAAVPELSSIGGERAAPTTLFFAILAAEALAAHASSLHAVVSRTVLANCGEILHCALLLHRRS